MRFSSLFEAFAKFVINRSRFQKMTAFLLVDMLAVPASIWIASSILGQTQLWRILMLNANILIWMVFMSLAGGVISYVLGLPRIKLNSYEQTAIQKSAVFAVLVILSGYVFQSMFSGFALFSASGYVILAMTLLILSVSTRILMRNIIITLYRQETPRKKVLIYGAGQTGVQLAAALTTDDAYKPVGFVDDNLSLHNVTVAGLRVYSPIQIENVVRDLEADRVVLAMPSIARPKQARITRRLESLGCTVVVLPSFAALMGTGDMLERAKYSNPTDFLNREKLDADLEGLSDLYRGKSVMISGAGGSIGSELVRQILDCKPRRIVLFEISEYALYQLGRELEELGVSDNCDIVPILGSIVDPAVVSRTIENNSVEIMLHAAAYKHVNIVETNELAGVYNNVFGTRVLAEAARDAQLEHFILVSTDKAVRPTNIMGATKRLAEMVVQDQATRTNKTKFSIVRFGNVLGSSGSVVPLFDEQIARGGPVTLTHTHVTRYFMTISEAARLVLMAGNFAEKSDMFVLDMGEPVSIHRLAEQMIEAAGYSVRSMANPDGDIEIEIHGLKPGEKLHEELLSDEAEVSQTPHPKILRVEEPRISELELARVMQRLTKALETGDHKAARLSLRECVGHYVVDEDTQDIICIS